MIRYLGALVFAASLLAFTTDKLQADSPPPAAAQTQTGAVPPLSTVSSERPWVIPGEEHCRTPLSISNERVGEALVAAKAFQCPAEPPPVDVDFYYMRSDGQLYVRTLPLALRHLSSYSIAGRTFAYRASLGKVGVRSDGRREYLGAVFVLYYYDEDGDGKFETRYGNLTSLKLPDWYKGK